MKKTSLIKNFILSSFYQVLIIIVPLITTPYVARILGAEGNGIYSYTFSIQTYFSMFAALGTVSYGTRKISQNREDEKIRSKIFWEIEILTIITSIISLIAWALFILAVTRYRTYLIILTANILAATFDISWFYTGIEQFKHTVTQNSIFKILGVVFIFVFVRSKNDLAVYVIIMSMTTLIGNMSMWIYLPKYLVKIDRMGLRIGKHLKETLIYFVPTIATSVYTILDKTLIGVIAKDIKENGYYDQATKIITLAKNVTFTSLNAVMGTRISYLFKHNRIDEIKNKIDISIDYIVFIGVGSTVGLCATSTVLIPVFLGEGYQRVISLLYFMSPLILIIGVSNCLGTQYYTPSGKRLQSAKYIIEGAVVNLILNIILIPKFESVGAIIASIIAELAISFLYFKNCDDFLKGKQVLSKIWKKAMAGIIMFASIAIVKKQMSISISNLLLEIIFGTVVYILTLMILKDSFTITVYKEIRKRIKGDLDKYKEL